MRTLRKDAENNDDNATLLATMKQHSKHSSYGSMRGSATFFTSLSISGIKNWKSDFSADAEYKCISACHVPSSEIQPPDSDGVTAKGLTVGGVISLVLGCVIILYSIYNHQSATSIKENEVGNESTVDQITE